MSHSGLSVGVFAKFPRPGQVKTRLIPDLGELQAAQLAHFLIARSLAQLADMGEQIDAIVLWTSGGEPDEWKTLVSSMTLPLSTADLTFSPQPEGDLGHRMQWAVSQQLKASRFAMLVGADAIGFGAEQLASLVQACKQSKDQIAFCPADDGGYVAVCMGTTLPAIFSSDINWGTDVVAQQTRSILAALNKDANWLPSVQDLDDISDFNRALASGTIPKDWRHLYGSGSWLLQQ